MLYPTIFKTVLLQLKNTCTPFANHLSTSVDHLQIVDWFRTLFSTEHPPYASVHDFTTQQCSGCGSGVHGRSGRKRAWKSLDSSRGLPHTKHRLIYQICM